MYRARDSRLNRDVAIKTLPAAFANDAERMARFQREAQVLAALNHPNIAAIYGIEESAIVMELVEGKNLARAGSGGRSHHHRASDCGCARCGASEEHHSSRSETGQHKDHAGRQCEGAGLRAWRRPSRPNPVTGRSCQLTDGDHGGDAGGDDPGDGRLHESGAGARQGSG